MRKKVNLKRTLKILGTGVLGPPNFRVRESQGLSKFWSLGNTVYVCMYNMYLCVTVGCFNFKCRFMYDDSVLKSKTDCKGAQT